jgi:peptidoglycan/LPS O-acetylase OafA/YrhL
LVGVALLTRVSLYFSGLTIEIINGLTPSRLDALAVGALLACYEREPSGLRRLIPAAWAAIGVAFLAAVLHAWAFGHLICSTPPAMTVGFTLVAFAFGGVVVLAVTATSRPLHWFLSMRLLKAFGKYSYGIYVIHGLLPAKIYASFPVALLTPYTHSYALALFIHLGVIIAGCFGVAWLSWHVYEKHFLKLKRLFEYDNAGNSGARKPLETSLR